MVENSTNALRSVQELLDASFIVEKYQRGYKWDVTQVRQLLEDIEEYYENKSSTLYCLQPVIITTATPESEAQWEVIDGQQRLSTIYLILLNLGVTPYLLKYSTRKRSEEFLLNINSILVTPLEISLDDDKAASNNLESGWSKFIEINGIYNNIDNYHFFKAYHYIKNWLNDEKTDSDKFKSIFLEEVKIIWHYVDLENLSAEEVFINFNKGKIPLDQADLIKAEFILHINDHYENKEIRKLKSQEFATEWNNIEKELQKDDFWFFISNIPSGKLSFNRIDLIFDLLQNKKKKDRDRLFSYYKMKKEDFNEDVWKDITRLFFSIKEWFDERTTYHLVGFILYARIRNLDELLTFFKDSISKQEFQNKLRNEIKSYVITHSEYLDFENISYQHGECLSLLILHNIALEEQTDASFKFPFYKLKKQDWNIEHIHAQNPKEFNSKQEVTDWIEDAKSLHSHLKASQEKDEIRFPIQLLEQLEQLLQSNEPKLNKLHYVAIENLNLKLKDYFKTDHISNLCLLDGPTNKAIGNNSFMKKRKEVLDIAIAGQNSKGQKVFVPIGTQRVFSKTYNLEESPVQFTFWGSEDRRLYMSKFTNSIKNFISV
ncbi:DUF262 domain-containing protein [Mesoflavibacter zeaxanthinifaciens]|jgi:uncharacterized protein with ParB-like and HNH nuclease domain|uniref:DUF262 domain-containing protein n=1 Tax=Mesoflavibacter zeaxanthinifaciens TaxID=393060 RepID=UPI003A8D7C6A